MVPEPAQSIAAQKPLAKSSRAGVAADSEPPRSRRRLACVMGHKRANRNIVFYRVRVAPGAMPGRAASASFGDLPALAAPAGAAAGPALLVSGSSTAVSCCAERKLPT